MNDYVESLALELRRTAEREGSRRRTRLAEARVPTRRAMTAAAAAFALALFGLAGSSVIGGTRSERAFAFPVLARAATDASHIDIAPQLRRTGADLTEARAIATQYGTGYVLPTQDGGLCLAAPDHSDGYGMACAAKDQIESEGLKLSFVPIVSGAPGQTAATTPAEFIVVLPDGAGAPVAHHSDGSTSTVAVRDGVADATFTEATTFTYEINGRGVTVKVPGVSVRGPLLARCNGPKGTYNVYGHIEPGKDPCS
jgi:hypothetical protein